MQKKGDLSTVFLKNIKRGEKISILNFPVGEKKKK